MADWKDITPLGKNTEYKTDYDPALLFPIPRINTRESLGYDTGVPFTGYDQWTAYEISWLNANGKPCVAILKMEVPAESPFIVESKSLKLYFNSLNHTRFENAQKFLQTIQFDIENAVRASVRFSLLEPAQWPQLQLGMLPGESIDNEAVSPSDYTVNETLLSAGTEQVEESLYSHLLRSNCPVTNQPDWASVWIHYTGAKISRAGLLEYLISFRSHNEFHEQCVERIFRDIMQQCAPEKLTVYARFTRRGGIDINPFRTNENYKVEEWRQVRQ